MSGQERYHLGLKVLDMDHAPLSQEFLKRGCPHRKRHIFATLPESYLLICRRFAISDS
jgi:hypothetical protein